METWMLCKDADSTHGIERAPVWTENINRKLVESTDDTVFVWDDTGILYTYDRTDTQQVDKHKICWKKVSKFPNLRPGFGNARAFEAAQQAVQNTYHGRSLVHYVRTYVRT